MALNDGGDGLRVEIYEEEFTKMWVENWGNLPCGTCIHSSGTKLHREVGGGFLELPM